MKITARCRVCHRELPVDLLLTSESAGHCPFCGTPLDAQYGVMLVQALAELQNAATRLESVLEQVQSYGPNLDLDEASILEPLRAALAHRAAKVGRPA